MASRRDFLVTSIGAVALGTMGRTALLRAWQQPQQTPAPALDPVFTPIRRNVGFFTCRGGTIGYLINSDAVVVVDSQYPDAAKLCVEGLQQRASGRGIDWLIN